MATSDETNSLLDAANGNDLKGVKYLVEEKGVPLTATVAYIAAECGYFDLLRYVADKSPELLEKRDQGGNTVLHLAMRHGGIDLELVKYLVEEKNMTLTRTNESRQTVACLAAKCGRVDVIKYAAEKVPFTLSRPDTHYETVLHLEDERKLFDLIKFLEEKYQYDIPRWNRENFECTAAHVAAQFGHLDVLRHILDARNGNPNALNERDQPVIFSAVKSKRLDMVMYLIEEKNVTLSLVDEIQENVLFVCVHADNFKAMRYILDDIKTPFDLNAKNSYGTTILHHAAIEDRMGILIYLVQEKKVNVNVIGYKGYTPLHSAAYRNNYEVCKFLIDHGANPEIRDEEGDFPHSSLPEKRIETLLKRARGSRSRRSVVPYSADETISRLYEYDTRIGVGGGNPPRLLNDGFRDTRTTYWQDVYSFHLPAFLVIASSIFKNAKGLADRESVAYSANSSPSVVLEEKIDPIAVDAVHEILL